MKRFIAWIKNKLKRLTFKVSKAVTAVVMVLGALVSINSPERIAIAGLTFIFGLPLGLMIFGPHVFSIPIWLAIVVVILFAMNLHNAWEVAESLKAGGLNYIMVGQAVSAVKTVTPSGEDIDHLNLKVEDLNHRFRDMSDRNDGYDGDILLPYMPGKPLLEER